MTLRTRFMFYVVGLTIGSFALYAGALSWTQREFLSREQERANIEETSRWTLLCEQSVLSKDEITLVHYVRDLRRSGDVEWVSFLTGDGRILLHSQMNLKNTVATDPISLWALSLSHPSRKTFKADNGSSLTVYAGPVYRGFESAGVALLVFNDRRQAGRVASSLWSSLRRFAGATLVCLLVGIGVAMGVARGLVSPLNELTGAVKRLGSGDWHARAAVHRKDEIGELAAAFRQMSHELARLDELKDEFIATVSHDLRNPLGAITMAARYLLNPPHPMTSEMTRQVVNTILLSTARLRNMVDNILDAAKIKEGGLVSQREPFSVTKVMGELHDLFRAQAEEYHRKFRCVTPAEFPLAVGDEAQTYRLLCNLLTNAFKFTSHGDHIGLKAETTPDGALAISVQDTGPGISPEDLATLFTRFKTGENAASHVKKQQGTGLGLAIAKALAEAQGGTLTVQSQKDQGTTFRFVLPSWKAP